MSFKIYIKPIPIPIIGIGYTDLADYRSIIGWGMGDGWVAQHF